MADRLHRYRDGITAVDLTAYTYPYGQGQPGQGLQLTLVKDLTILSVRLPAPDAAALIRQLLIAFPEAPGDTLLNASEVARMFRVDPKTVSRWAATHQLDCVRTPGGHRRYRLGQVLALLDGARE